jgi:hypothetical protein
MEQFRLLAYTQDLEIVWCTGTHQECRDELRRILHQRREKQGRIITESPSGNRARIAAKDGASYMMRISEPLTKMF